MSAPPDTPEHRYSIAEFVGHFDHFVREGTSQAALLRYFSTHYPNNSEACYKMNRFGMAFSYLPRHLQEEDFEQFVVLDGGGRRGLVSRPLVVALARYFGPLPKECLNDEPSRELILKMAKEET
jgi:hypothetical protein